MNVERSCVPPGILTPSLRSWVTFKRAAHQLGREAKGRKLIHTMRLDSSHCCCLHAVVEHRAVLRVAPCHEPHAPYTTHADPADLSKISLHPPPTILHRTQSHLRKRSALRTDSRPAAAEMSRESKRGGGARSWEEERHLESWSQRIQCICSGSDCGCCLPEKRGPSSSARSSLPVMVSAMARRQCLQCWSHEGRE